MGTAFEIILTGGWLLLAGMWFVLIFQSICRAWNKRIVNPKKGKIIDMSARLCLGRKNRYSRGQAAKRSEDNCQCPEDSTTNIVVEKGGNKGYEIHYYAQFDGKLSPAAIEELKEKIEALNKGPREVPSGYEELGGPGEVMLEEPEEHKDVHYARARRDVWAEKCKKDNPNPHHHTMDGGTGPTSSVDGPPPEKPAKTSLIVISMLADHDQAIKHLEEQVASLERRMRVQVERGDRHNRRLNSDASRLRDAGKVLANHDGRLDDLETAEKMTLHAEPETHFEMQEATSFENGELITDAVDRAPRSGHTRSVIGPREDENEDRDKKADLKDHPR